MGAGGLSDCGEADGGDDELKKGLYEQVISKQLGQERLQLHLFFRQ